MSVLVRIMDHFIAFVLFSYSRKKTDVGCIHGGKSFNNQDQFQAAKICDL